MTLTNVWTAVVVLVVLGNLSLALHAVLGALLEEELRDFVDGNRWTVRLLLIAMVVACAIGGVFVWLYLGAVDYLESRGLYRPQGKGL